MITQVFLNWITTTVAGLITLIPPFPSQLSVWIGYINTGTAWMGAHLQVFGILIPWSLVGTLIQAWLLCIAFWASSWIIRFVIATVGKLV